MTFIQRLQAIEAALHVGFFLLMGFGLLLSSVLLYFSLITGDNWVTVCGILYGSDRVGHAFTSGMKVRRQDDGNARPVG